MQVAFLKSIGATRNSWQPAARMATSAAVAASDAETSSNEASVTPQVQVHQSTRRRRRRADRLRPSDVKQAMAADDKSDDAAEASVPGGKHRKPQKVPPAQAGSSVEAIVNKRQCALAKLQALRFRAMELTAEAKRCDIYVPPLEDGDASAQAPQKWRDSARGNGKNRKQRRKKHTESVLMREIAHLEELLGYEVSQAACDDAAAPLSASSSCDSLLWS